MLANTLRFQEYLVDKIGQVVTHQTGFKVEFEHADVASWVNSAITLKVCYIYIYIYVYICIYIYKVEFEHADVASWVNSAITLKVCVFLIVS